ncbi:hypothetical protein F5Y17DRAFT_256072 [Xylariaceae sp. FL0594]|nr:hypothetical protein F5Y17DRAFT_256072 [Xylariaceae sp. FL0594]
MAAYQATVESEDECVPTPSESSTGTNTPTSTTPPLSWPLSNGGGTRGRSGWPSSHTRDLSTSSTATPLKDNPDYTLTCVPEPGGRYMIRHVETKKAITLVDGHLTLLRNPEPGLGWHWHCEEQRGGWTGFRQGVSGNYLGHDNRGGFTVVASKMKGWECFALRPRQEGGYNLLLPDRSSLKGMGISGVNDPWPKLVLVTDMKDAAKWEFIKTG